MIRESRLTTPVSGLICRSCEDIILASIGPKKGILSVSVSYIKGVVDIVYDPDVISEDEIKSVLLSAGYPVCEKVRGGIIYDLLTVLAVFLVILLLDVVPLPSIPSLNKGAVTEFYLNVFLIGLVTGTHCIVMCGGIMLAGAGKEGGMKRRFINITIYNLMRVLVSILLGFIFGTAGNVISFSEKARSMIYVVSGLYVILVALEMWGVPGVRQLEVLEPKFCFMKHSLNCTGPVLLGIITAVMPCHASGTMWMVAMTLPSGAQGALMMTVWALGTVPAMFIFGLVSGVRKKSHHGLTVRVNIVLLLSLGLRLLMMGI